MKLRDLLLETWSARYGRPPMPVDGVRVGTAALTTKEAHCSWAVMELPPPDQRRNHKPHVIDFGPYASTLP